MNSKITEYKIVTTNAPAELINEVNNLIKEGWVPTGGITVVQTDFVRETEGHLGKQSITMQAMVKLKVF